MIIHKPKAKWLILNGLKTIIEEIFIVVFLLLLFCPNVTFVIEHSSCIRLLHSEEKCPLYQGRDRNITVPSRIRKNGSYHTSFLRQINDWLPQLPKWDEDPSWKRGNEKWGDLSSHQWNSQCLDGLHDSGSQGWRQNLWSLFLTQRMDLGSWLFKILSHFLSDQPFNRLNVCNSLKMTMNKLQMMNNQTLILYIYSDRSSSLQSQSSSADQTVVTVLPSSTNRLL